MNFNNTISSILRGGWLIDKGWANSQLPLLISLLQGNNVSFVNRTGNENFLLPFAIDAAGNRFDYNNLQNATQNSVGVIPITGAITKYNGECGEVGSIQRTSFINAFAKNNNISSIVQILDTPGGESRAAHDYVNAIKNCGKPVLTYVDGMCASLGMWYASASKEVWLANEFCEMGSIGTYCTLADFNEYFAMQGIKLIEVYAPQSSEKNKDYKDAISGDTSSIEDNLKIITEKFIDFVASNRNVTARKNKNEWNKGKMFLAEEAINIGLADNMGSLEKVINRAAFLARKK